MLNKKTTHAHSPEDNSEVVLVIVVNTLVSSLHETGLSADLRGDVVVRQTRSGEDGDLLTSCNTVHHINS